MKDDVLYITPSGHCIHIGSPSEDEFIANADVFGLSLADYHEICEQYDSDTLRIAELIRRLTSKGWIRIYISDERCQTDCWKYGGPAVFLIRRFYTKGLDDGIQGRPLLRDVAHCLNEHKNGKAFYGTLGDFYHQGKIQSSECPILSVQEYREMMKR